VRQETLRIIHPTTVEGECRVVCGVLLTMKEDANTMIKLVIKRHGSKMTSESRSFAPGRTPQSLNRFLFRSEYQTRAIAGRWYTNIRAISVIGEKAACPSPRLTEPERNKTA
jgi:hypothetical protein